MLDYFFIGYFLWRLFKGYTNGIGKEVESLFFTLLFLCAVVGVYIISELTGLIKSALQTVLTSSGVWISLSSLLAAIFLFFFIRGKVVDYAEEHEKGNSSSYIGTIIGGFRSIIVIYLIVMLLNYIPFGLFSDSLKQSKIATPLLNLIALQKINDKPTNNPLVPFEYDD